MHVSAPPAHPTLQNRPQGHKKRVPRALAAAALPPHQPPKSCLYLLAPVTALLRGSPPARAEAKAK